MSHKETIMAAANYAHVILGGRKIAIPMSAFNGMGREEALENIFAGCGNNPSTHFVEWMNGKVQSMSVGDAVWFPNERDCFWFCAAGGWERVNIGLVSIYKEWPKCFQFRGFKEFVKFCDNRALYNDANCQEMIAEWKFNLERR